MCADPFDHVPLPPGGGQNMYVARYGQQYGWAYPYAAVWYFCPVPSGTLIRAEDLIGHRVTDPMLLTLKARAGEKGDI